MSQQAEGQYGRSPMVLEWDPNDRINVVTVPELPGCQTHSATLEEAIKQGRDACERRIDVAREIGKAVPPPRHFVVEPIDAPAGELAEVR